MKRWLSLLLALLPMSIYADQIEIEIGTKTHTDSYYSSDVPLLLDNSLDFRRQVTTNSIEGAYYWETSRYEFAEFQTLESFQDPTGTKLVEVQTYTDRFSWGYRHSNIDLSLGVDILRVGNNLGSYTLTNALVTSRAQLPFLMIKVDQDREFFRVGQKNFLRNWMEGSSTYSTKIYRESELAVGAYLEPDQKMEFMMLEKKVISPTAYTDLEIDWLFTYGDQRPMEPNREAYWKSWDFSALYRIKGAETYYLVDYVNAAALYFLDVQNVISYGIHYQSKAIQYNYDAATTTSWNMTEEFPKLTHAIEVTGSSPIPYVPLSFEWTYHLEEVPMVGLSLHQSMEFKVKGNF